MGTEGALLRGQVTKSAPTKRVSVGYPDGAKYSGVTVYTSELV